MNAALTVSAVSAASPDMSGAEFEEFVADIRKNGQLVPIWIRGDEIIDGRKRFAACQQLGRKPITVELAPEDDPAERARSLNVLRTHYTIGQRAIFAAKRANATKSYGAKLRHGTASRNSEMLTVAEAAKESGVSPDHVAVAKAIRRDAAPEVVAAVESGKLSLHKAEQIAKAHAKDDQPGAVKRAIAEKTERAIRSTEKKTNGRHAIHYKRHHPKATEIVRRTVAMLEGLCAGIENVPPGDVDRNEAPDWAAAIEKAVAELRKFARGLRGVR